MPIWPTVLPQAPLRGGYKRSVPSLVIRSSMDNGSDKVRRRGGNKPHVVSATYVLDDAQVAALETFCKETIADGAICFDWPDQEHSGDYVKARLKAGNEGLFDVEAYSGTLLWQVKLDLEIWPGAPLTSPH